jgi:hypothetical protein
MKATPDSRAGEQTVLVIGGNGGLSSRYREIVERRGYSLKHYEKRVPAGARHSVGKIALIVVMVTMVSHALREQAQEIASDGARIVYLKSPSVSALRAVVETEIG